MTRWRDEVWTIKSKYPHRFVMGAQWRRNPGSGLKRVLREGEKKSANRLAGWLQVVEPISLFILHHQLIWIHHHVIDQLVDQPLENWTNLIAQLAVERVVASVPLANRDQEDIHASKHSTIVIIPLMWLGDFVVNRILAISLPFHSFATFYSPNSNARLS